MAKIVWDNDQLVIVRHALQPLWENTVGFKGRCWGPNRDGNLFPETNIALGREEKEGKGESVTICKKDGKVVIYPFREVEENKLGKEIEDILEKLEKQFQRLFQQYPDKWIALDVYTQQLIGTADDYQSIMGVLREKGIKQEYAIVEHLTADRKPILGEV